MNAVAKIKAKRREEPVSERTYCDEDYIDLKRQRDDLLNDLDGVLFILDATAATIRERHIQRLKQNRKQNRKEKRK